MGTGCDTILAQIAAEVLDCSIDEITVFGADTDTSPYDSGSYASSTTYVTGKAVEQCALKVREQICKLGAELLKCPESEVVFDGKFVKHENSKEIQVSLTDIATASQCGKHIPAVKMFQDQVLIQSLDCIQVFIFLTGGKHIHGDLFAAL